MHPLLWTFLIALTNNFDNIGARIAYSMSGIRLNIFINLWITVITFVISFLATVSGTMITGSLGRQFAAVIAMVLLVAIGASMTLEPYWKKKCRNNPSGNKSHIFGILWRPEHADLDNSKHIDFKEATLLGVALSMNNIGGGLSAGMIGLNAFLLASLAAVLNFVVLWAGNYLAEFFIKQNLTDRAAVVGGIVLIGIGIEQLL